jgi:hypothetical protein
VSEREVIFLGNGRSVGEPGVVLVQDELEKRHDLHEICNTISRDLRSLGRTGDWIPTKFRNSPRKYWDIEG